MTAAEIDPHDSRPERTTSVPKATGRFDVQLNPQATDAPIGRMSIDKQLYGDLEGTSKGEMLAVSSTAVKGSAGYVAMEVVTGTLHGRKGSFALQHNGTMNRGAQSLVVLVVPDSGTGELAQIAGTLRILIEGKEHRYELDYTL